MLQLEQRCLIFLICLGYVMRSIQMIGVVLLAGASLVFCGDDGKKGKKSGSESKYKLKISGLSENEATGAELNVKLTITSDNKPVTEGDVASTELTLLIECGKHEVAKQEDKAADKGEVKFDPISIEGDKFTGDCTLTVSGKIAGEDVEVKQNFSVSANANITLPKPSESDPLPTASSAVIVGRPFTFNVDSADKLKVQPQTHEGLCKGNLLLIYYDGTTVREVLTAGETIKPKNKVVSGLAVVKVSPDVKVAQACKDDKDASSSPSIELTASPNLLKGMQLPVNEASDTPSLGNATLENDNDKIKLSWTTVEGFEGGADVFFNNALEGNEWTKHSPDVTWNASGSVVSTLAYELPVKVLIKVKATGARKVPHWLFFIKTQ